MGHKFSIKKPSIKKPLVALGMFAVLAMSGQALALTTNLGAQTGPVSLTLVNTFLSPQNQFYDDYLFSISSSSVDSMTSTMSLGSLLGINNLQTRLYSGTLTTTGVPSGLLEAWSTAIPLSATGVNGTIAVISPINLGAGNYILEVRGDVVGTAGGSYAGVVNISPVPEEDAIVMMVGGLGVIGFLLRRRKNETALIAA